MERDFITALAKRNRNTDGTKWSLDEWYLLSRYYGSYWPLKLIRKDDYRGDTYSYRHPIYWWWQGDDYNNKWFRSDGVRLRRNESDTLCDMARKIKAYDTKRPLSKPDILPGQVWAYRSNTGIMLIQVSHVHICPEGVISTPAIPNGSALLAGPSVHGLNEPRAAPGTFIPPRLTNNDYDLLLNPNSCCAQRWWIKEKTGIDPCEENYGEDCLSYDEDE